MNGYNFRTSIWYDFHVEGILTWSFFCKLQRHLHTHLYHKRQHGKLLQEQLSTVVPLEFEKHPPFV